MILPDSAQTPLLAHGSMAEMSTVHLPAPNTVGGGKVVGKKAQRLFSGGKEACPETACRVPGRRAGGHRSGA